jgi:guanylate kinase
MIAEQAFLEYAKVFDNFYGTSRQSVEQLLKNGNDVILEIDWQGARQIRDKIKGSISIFILPPSIDILRKRLEGRGQDNKDVIERRMSDAINEMGHYKDYDYLVVNDDFSQALIELKSIIICHRLEKKRQLENKQSLLETLINHDDIFSPNQN